MLLLHTGTEQLIFTREQLKLVKTGCVSLRVNIRDFMVKHLARLPIKPSTAFFQSTEDRSPTAPRRYLFQI